MVTPRSGDLRMAAAAAAVTFGLYVMIHRALAKDVDWREARLWALGAGCSMYFLGI